LGFASLIIGAVLFLAAPITLVLTVQVWRFADQSPEVVVLQAWLARVGVSIVLLLAVTSVLFGIQGIRLAMSLGQPAALCLAGLLLSLAALGLWVITAIALLNTTESLVGGGRPKADLSAIQLLSEYSDVSKADEKYKGKYISVSGRMLWVGYSWLTPYGYRSVQLGQRGSGKVSAIVCHFPPASARQAEYLREGEFVVIRGVCGGELLRGIPFLSKCVVVR
jgi:hypothetical protein